MVFSWAVDVACSVSQISTSVEGNEWLKLRTHPWSTSAHSSGRRQYSNTDRVCFIGSYAARFFDTISENTCNRCEGSNRPTEVPLRSFGCSNHCRTHCLFVHSAEPRPNHHLWSRRLR